MTREHAERVREACAKVVDGWVHDAELVLWSNPNSLDIQAEYKLRKALAERIAADIRALKLEDLLT